MIILCRAPFGEGATSIPRGSMEDVKFIFQKRHALWNQR